MKRCGRAVLLADAEAFSNFFCHGRCRRGGECKHATDAEFFCQSGKAEIVRSEIVPPLGDAMGLVNRKQGGGIFAETG